jgi:hypothetical protein
VDEARRSGPKRKRATSPIRSGTSSWRAGFSRVSKPWEAHGRRLRPPRESRLERETVRQYKEAFDQNKHDVADWNSLRLSALRCALAVFLVLSLVSAYVLLRLESYEGWTLQAALGALLAFSAAAWRLMLRSHPREVVPVVRHDEKDPRER